MNVKLVDLLLDDVYNTIKTHLSGCELVRKKSYVRNMIAFSLKKRVPFLWWFSRLKKIGELRYSLSPYLTVELYDTSYYWADNLNGCLEGLETDLRRRGFLTKNDTIEVNIGVEQ